jgi:hypothetical protein
MPENHDQNPARVVFLHIPKTAGTSLHLLLIDRFEENAICPIRNHKLDEMSMEQLQKYRLFSGHYYFDQVERIPEPKILLTMLREPKARLLSLYNYHRSFRWDAIAEPEADSGRRICLAKTLSALEYFRCADPVVYAVVNNSMARQLIGLKYNLPDGKLRISDDGVLNLALKNLERFAAIGFVDSPNGSLRRFGEVLPIGLPESMPRHNTFESLKSDSRFEQIERSIPTEAVDAELIRHTQIDQRIYNYALCLFKPCLPPE